MTITVEMISVCVVVGAHWIHSVRRSSRVEAKVDRIEDASRDAHARLIDHGERLSRIEGRLNGSP